MGDDFPTDLKAFIAQSVESLAQLEALLLLQRDPLRCWTATELARSLYISDDMCAGLMVELERRQFAIKCDDATAIRYAAGRADDDRLLAELGRLYQERRVAVITEIYSKPVNKVQTFADAFRLRWEK